MLTPCMGGWCRSREKCAHYHAPGEQRAHPIERICGEREQPSPLRVIRLAAFRRPITGAPT